MKWIGKAPFVAVISKAELVAEMKAAGFVDIVEHEVGAKDTTAFIVARKPA